MSVRERPILFSAPMVRAILAGTKTQTRRVVKPQPDGDGISDDVLPANPYGYAWRDAGDGVWHCPYGIVGERLWVRETWKPHSTFAHLKPSAIPPSNVFYAADDRYSPSNVAWRPSLFMPRWACRLLLEVTDVRVQRLQEISEDDAKAEGVEKDADRWHDYLGNSVNWLPTAERSFMTLWDSINAKRAPWASNPWVWAITFKATGATP